MSERTRIESLINRFSGEGLIVPSGDDAAVARPGGAVSVTSIDAVAAGVHFDLATWPEHAVGYKAVAAALSDLAAMGARAGEIYVAAGLPQQFSEDQFERLTAGIAAAALASDATVAGGDLVLAGELWLSVTVVGYADDADAVITRTGARPGDAVVVTGTLGGSALALELIERGQIDSEDAVQKQFAPTPRLAAGAALARAGASAMIDISDGLARDAEHIARASEIGIEIELSQIPLASGVLDPADAAGSGEEYELLATLPADRVALAQAAVAENGNNLTVIGAVVAGSGVRVLDAQRRDVEVGGFDHFD